MDNELMVISQKMAKYSHGVLYIAILFGTIFFRRLNSLHKSILGYVLLLLLSDYLTKIFKYYTNNNLMVLYIYSFLELAFMLYFYKKHMFRNKQLFLTGLAVVGLIYIITEMLLIFVFKGLVVKEFQPYAKVVDNFVIVLMALGYLHERVSRFRESQWGDFRLNMVFLVFFTLNTMIFLPFNFMINAAGNTKFYFWMGHIILLILFYLYLTAEIAVSGLNRTKGPIAK